MAVYYFDNINGDNTNTAPYSPSNALKELPGTEKATGNAVFNPTASDILLLARGGQWNTDTRWLFLGPNDGGSAGSPIIIDAYDRPGETNQPKPIVESFRYLTSWTLSGTSGVWYADLPVNTRAVNRVFFNLVGQKAGATSIVTCTADTPYWFDGVTDRLYVYSGSDIDNPTAVYGEVKCTSDVTSTNGWATIHIQRCGYIHIKNITVRGSNVYCISVQNNLLTLDTGGIIVEDCNLEYPGQSCMQFNTTVAQDMVGYMAVRRNNFDMKWTPNENTGSSDEGDGINLLSAGLNQIGSIIEYNNFLNFPHSAVTSSNPSTARMTKGLTMRYNDISCPNTEYGRGFGVSGDGTFDSVFIYGNYIHNTNTRNQIEGTNVYFSANIIDTVRPSVVQANTSQGVSSASRINVVVDNVVIANNIILNTDDDAIRLTDAAGEPIDNYYCYNNIAIKQSGETTDTVLYYADNVLPNGTVSIRNNILFSDSPTTAINWDGTTYSVENFNSTESVATGNLSDDPLLSTDGNYYPAPDSPVWYAGAWTGKFLKDFGGRPFKTPNPSIGAWEATSREARPQGTYIIQYNPVGAWAPIESTWSPPRYRINRWNP